MEGTTVRSGPRLAPSLLGMWPAGPSPAGNQHVRPVGPFPAENHHVWSACPFPAEPPPPLPSVLAAAILINLLADDGRPRAGGRGA